MAGLSGKSAWLGMAKQAAGAKGGAAAAIQYKVPFSGGNISPVRETDRLAETDSSRDQSAAFVTTAGVEGSPEVYVRDDSIGLLLLGAFGLDTPSGATNFTHVFTPTATLPYLAFWRNVGGATGIYEKFSDCMVSSLTFAAEAGQPITCAAGIQGRTPLRFDLTADAAAITTMNAVALGQSQVYNYNLGTVTLGGGATSLIRSFEITIENNVVRQQTDDVIPWDVVPGTREISLGFDMLFETLDEYDKFHYGAIAGTVVSPNIFTTSANFSFAIGANNSIAFDLPSLAYEEFPIEPDPGGDPIVVSCRAVAQKATGVPNLLTATLKNQVATY